MIAKKHASMGPVVAVSASEYFGDRKKCARIENIWLGFSISASSIAVLPLGTASICLQLEVDNEHVVPMH